MALWVAVHINSVLVYRDLLNVHSVCLSLSLINPRAHARIGSCLSLLLVYHVSSHVSLFRRPDRLTAGIYLLGLWEANRIIRPGLHAMGWSRVEYDWSTASRPTRVGQMPAWPSSNLSGTFSSPGITRRGAYWRIGVPIIHSLRD